MLILIYSTKYLPLIAVKVLSVYLHPRLNLHHFKIKLFIVYQQEKKTQTNHGQQTYTPHILTNLHRITLKITHLGRNLHSTVYSFQSKLLFGALFRCDYDKSTNHINFFINMQFKTIFITSTKLQV